MKANSRYSLEGLVYDASVRAPRDCQVTSDVCRVAVTLEVNGWVVWIALTDIDSDRAERIYQWHFSAMYDDREEAIERAVDRTRQERAVARETVES